MRTLHQCLLDTDLIQLRVIAHFWGIELASSRKRDIAAELAQAMSTPAAVADTHAALTEAQRQVLDALLGSSGRMPLRVLMRQWGEIRSMGPGRMEREKPWQEPISPVEALWYRGFIFRAFEHGAEGTREVAFVPRELQAHLPPPPTLRSTLFLDPTAAPPITRVAGDRLLDDACTLLTYLQNEPLHPGANDVWPAHHETRLAHQMIDPDAARGTFLRHLAHRLEWLRTTDSGRLRPDPGPTTAWLKSPVTRQRQLLAEAWQDDPSWNDLFHVPALQPEDTGAWRNDPVLARTAILRHLTTCVPQAWYRLDQFCRAVEEATPDFQRPDGDYTTWYIRDAASGAYLAGFEHWDEVEGALIRYLLTGPLAWLGLVDQGADTPAGASVAFRISEAGASFLGLADPPQEAEPPLLALRPGFGVLVPPARRYERFQLARVADWVQSGDPFIYRLTPDSLGRARQQGIPVARVLEFLQESIRAPLPHPIEAALTRWEAHGAEARLERVVLLRLSDEELMAQVTASPATRSLIQEQVGPTVALVREQDWIRLATALGELGLLPEIVTLE